MDVMRIGSRVAGAAKYSIWESKCCVEPIQPDRVSGDSGRKRKTRTGLKQSIHLPSAGYPSEETRFILRFGQLPDVVDRRNMPHVEIGQAAIEPQVKER